MSGTSWSKATARDHPRRGNSKSLLRGVGSGSEKDGKTTPSVKSSVQGKLQFWQEMLSGSNSKANTSTSKSVSFASDTTLQPISSSDASSSSSPSAASSLSASSASRSRQKKVGLHHASSSTSRPLSFDASRSPVCQPPSPSPNVASSSTIVSRSKRTTSSPQTEFLRSSHRIGVSNATSQNRRSSSMENEPKKKSIIDWNALSDSDEDNEGLEASSEGKQINWDELSDEENNRDVNSWVPTKDGGGIDWDALSASSDEEGSEDHGEVTWQEQTQADEFKRMLWARLDEEYEEELRELQEASVEDENPVEDETTAKKTKSKLKESKAKYEYEEEEHKRVLLGQELSGKPFIPSYIISYVLEDYLKEAKGKPKGPLKQGYLTKCASNRHGGRRKRRWCILNDQELLYYQRFGDVEPRGSIHLSSVLKCEAYDSKSHSFAFDVVTGDKSFLMHADNTQDREDWIYQINAASQDAKNACVQPVQHASSHVMVDVKVPAIEMSKLVKMDGNITYTRARDIISGKFKQIPVLSSIHDNLHLYLPAYNRWLDEVLLKDEFVSSVLRSKSVILLKERKAPLASVTFQFAS